MSVTIDRDTYEEWQAHPVTELLMRACAIGVDDVTKAWLASSLEAGRCDPLVLAAMRERQKVLREIMALTAVQLEEIINEHEDAG